MVGQSNAAQALLNRFLTAAIKGFLAVKGARAMGMTVKKGRCDGQNFSRPHPAKPGYFRA